MLAACIGFSGLRGFKVLGDDAPITILKRQIMVEQECPVSPPLCNLISGGIVKHICPSFCNNTPVFSKQMSDEGRTFVSKRLSTRHPPDCSHASAWLPKPLLVLHLCQAGVVLDVLVLKRPHFIVTLRSCGDRKDLNHSC